MRRPLSVVGTDQEALSALLALHACPEPRILDVTHNRGRMWKGLPYRPHRSDRDPLLFDLGYTDTVADFRALPFPDASFDVIVFDPPHITDAGDGIAGDRQYAAAYGTRGADIQGGSIGFLFPAFIQEARRVLEPDTGVVLAKIADQVHGAEYQWQHIELITEAQRQGLKACDVMLTVSWSRGSLIDPRWRRVCHARQVHCYWLALRNGPDCISPTAPRADVKPRTAEMFAGVEVA